MDFIVKAVLFDLDNTLIDFIKLKRNASSAAARAMVKAGLKFNGKNIENELFDFYLKDGIDGNTAFQNFMKLHHGKIDDRILAAGINAYLSAKDEWIKPYPKVGSTLGKLRKKGLKLGVVTDAPRLKAYQRLDAMGIVGFFDVVVGFEDTGKQKPSSLPFRKALSKLNLEANEVLMVGDWPERDIEGAKKLGMKTCWASYGGNSLNEKIKADFEINKFEEILDILGK